MTAPLDLAPYDAGYGGTAAFLAVLFAYRLQNLVRHPSDLAAKGVCVAFGFTAAAFTFAAPTVYLRVDAATGVPNLATLGVYLCILATSVSFLAVLALWTGWTVRVVRPLAAAYLVVVAAMVALFVAGRPHDGEHPIDFDAHFAATPYLSQFLLLYYAGFALAMGGTSWLSLRYSRMAARPWLVRGLRWTSCGAAFALGYCLLKVIAVVGLMAGARTESLSTVWAPLSATVGALTMAVGLTMPVWAPAVTGVYGRTLACGRLYPLWRTLTDAAPAVVLEPRTPRPLTAWAARWPLRDGRHLLYRRVVEIHDARLALGPHLDPAAGEALGLRRADFGADVRRFEAAQEAAMLAGAARARRAGVPATRTTYPLSGELGGEWEEQLSWLLLVAHEFTRLPQPTPRTP